jgi:tetratricopeptide (TPR) repeat protein
MENQNPEENDLAGAPPEDSSQESKPSSSIEETRPAYENNPYADEVVEAASNETGSDGPDNNAPSRRNRRSWILMSVIGILTLLVIAVMSAAGGMEAGRHDFQIAQATQRSAQVQEQYVLALEDLAAGRDENARQRFEWIIQVDPSFPGVPEQLADIMIRLSITATPTPAPTPTLTPTLDTRTRDELFQSARQLMASGNWSEAIDTLLKLRKEDPTFQPIEVDGWLYISLRYRGLDKIKNADLEGGTYDLALAERFGPLDAEATNYRTWAELYVTGSSFWDVDWAQAVNYFSQLKLVAPYLMDGSGWTSLERYRLALTKYGDWLAMQGLWCEAEEQYQLALAERDDPSVQPTAVYAAEQCALPEEEREGEPEITVTPGPPGEGEATPIPPSGGETQIPPASTEPASAPTEESPTPTPTP